MKKTLSIILIVFTLLALASACTSDKVIDGKLYKTYGLLNKDEVKDPNIKYELSVGNVLWGAITLETVVGPIYFFGFDIYEPVGKISNIDNTNGGLN